MEQFERLYFPSFPWFSVDEMSHSEARSTSKHETGAMRAKQVGFCYDADGPQPIGIIEIGPFGGFSEQSDLDIAHVSGW
jgi:hypothetical protein